MRDGAERTLEDGLQHRLQYEASEVLRGIFGSFTFYLQIYIFSSGADGIRTHALRRAKAKWRVLTCPDASDNCSDLQVFYEFLAEGSSTTYWLVLAWLQYLFVALGHRVPNSPCPRARVVSTRREAGCR